jgi:hypothetical protein
MKNIFKSYLSAINLVKLKKNKFFGKNSKNPVPHRIFKINETFKDFFQLLSKVIHS